MSNIQICNNCLKEFNSEKGYRYHLKTVKCKKVDINTDGTLKNPVDNQCIHCFRILTTSGNLTAHQKICKKNKNIINTNNVSVSGNQNNTTIINGDNTSINISMPTFYLLQPVEPFKRVADNYINIQNVYYLFKHSIDNTVDNFNEYIVDFCKIVKNIYTTDVNIFDRNLWSLINKANKDYDVHYFKDDNWNIDDNCNNLVKNIINILLSQLHSACTKIIKTLQAVLDYNMKDINSYIEEYGTFKDVIIFENRVMFDLTKPVKCIINLYNKYKSIANGGSDRDVAESRILSIMKKEEPLPQTTIDNYTNVIRKYKSILSFANKENSKGLLAKNIKDIIIYDTNKNDQLVNDFIKYKI